MSAFCKKKKIKKNGKKRKEKKFPLITMRQRKENGK